MIVASKVREEVKKHDMLTGGLFADALRIEVTKLIKAAVHRAKSNGRKTVQDTDL